MPNSYYADENGFKVEVVRADADEVEFAAQGGGFLKKMARADFDARFKPYTVPPYTPRKAAAEFLPDDMVVDAFSNGQAWNGWAMPVFEFEAGKQLLPHLRELRFEAERDAFVWTGEDGNEDVFHSQEVQTEVGPVKVYPIGTGAWTWDWADENQTR